MRLLIIGDLGGQLTSASMIAQKRGARITQAPDIGKALELLRAGKGADVILIHVRLKIGTLVENLKAEHICIPVIACGIDETSEDAVRAIKEGAKEYLPLPPNEELIAAIFQAVSEDPSEVIAQSPAMLKIIEMANQVAPSEASILVTGESGTGKEIIARHIHKQSKRNKQDMISVNCAAIPENLLESELFGHEKGAFTGAVARRIGKFEEANGSTLLLDEISEMDLRLQAKLLRAIQEREIDRVGGSGPVKVDIRVIATSNRVLQEEVKKGTFREDLFFRLNVIHLHLPPLRERKEDIQSFAEFFARKYAKVNGLKEKPLSKKALARLEGHSWPGNVRELENTLHRAVLLSNGDEVEEGAILLMESGGATGGNGKANGGGLVGRTVEDVEKQLIHETLEHCLGNRTQAANILGISIRTLRNKLNAYQGE